MFASRVNIKDFDFEKRKLLPINKLTSHGSKLLDYKYNKALTYKFETQKYNLKDETPEKIKAFKVIQNICKKNHINLYYVFTPYFGKQNKTFYNRFLQLAHKDSIYSFNTNDKRYFDKKYFRDNTHMFREGAEIFTKELSDFLKDN